MQLPMALSLRRTQQGNSALQRSSPTRAYEALKEAAKSARLPYDKDIWLNLAFYLDEHYVEWTDEIRSIRQIPRPAGFENTPRPVANKIMHFVNQEHSFVLQTEPTVDVMPATDDPNDISDSTVSLAYLRWLSEPQVTDFDDELNDATMWALIAGTGYLKWVYNPKLKRPDILAASPLDLYIDPYARKFGSARYAIHSQFMDPEQVYDQYNIEVKPSGIERADPLRAALLHEMGTNPVIEGVTVNELWLKPCRRHPQGIFTVWAGQDILVPAIPYPYDHKRLPFTQLGQIRRPGSLYFASAVKYLRSAQMELNKYHAQKILNREGFANHKWWIPDELELEHDPDDAPMQILRGNSQGGQLKPEILQAEPFPDNQDGSWISDEMMNIVGLHEVSQGQVPGRVEAAKAIELLKESDVSRQATLLKTIKYSISEGFWQLLQLAKQYVPAEQIVQTYSREGIPEVHRFKAQTIKEGMRVKVTMTTGLARSRSARQDELLNMWDRGILRDPEKMAELLEIPVPTFIADKMFDIRLARNENYTMQGNADNPEGVPILPNSWDDHSIHIREHNNFRKTQEFLTASTKVKMKFEFHVKQHEEMQVQQLTRDAQLAMLAQGAQPGTQPGTQADSTAGGQGDTSSPQQEAAYASMTRHTLERPPS